MSVLIKAGASAHSVQRFQVQQKAIPPLPDAPEAEPKRPVEDPRLATLREENSKLKEAVAELRRAAPQNEILAREEGKREGLASARRDDEQRFNLLAETASAASAGWDQRLDSLENLSALIARTALSKLFDGADDYSDFIARMISRQIRVLRRETIVAIRVSPQDFGDPEALSALAAGIGTASTIIVSDPELAAGECRLDLQLGHIDLGLRSQWGELSKLMQDMANEEPQP